MDSLQDPALLDKYPPERVLRYPPDKDYTDTELAIQLLREKGCGEVWVLGGGGGRTDHLLAVAALFEREKAPDRWVTSCDDIRLLREGEGLGFSGGGERVSVFPVGSGPWEAESEGLRWPLEGLAWRRGFFGVSNRAEGEGFSIRSLRGRFLVVCASGNARLAPTPVFHYSYLAWTTPKPSPC